MKKTLIFGILIMALAACNKPLPQLPSNKDNAVDSTALALQAIQNRLAEREDSLLLEFAKNYTMPLQKDSTGFWFVIDKTKNNGLRLKNGDQCYINAEFFSLEGDLLHTENTEIFVGKREKTVVIDLILQKMSRGNEAVIVAPWYLAYGSKGNGHNIIGFTSLLIKLKVEED